MFIFLDTDDPDVAFKTERIVKEHYETKVVQGLIPIESEQLHQDKDTAWIFYGKNIFNSESSVGEARYQQLAFATEGSVLFSDTPRNESRSPIHVGNINACLSGAVMVHLRHAVNRAKLMQDLPVKYFGITKEDPKNALLIDNKKWEKNLPLIFDVLTNAPDTWWYDIAFISTPNSENLFDLFEDDMYYTTPVALTTSARAKMEHANLDFVDASDLSDGHRRGIVLRERTRRANDS